MASTLSSIERWKRIDGHPNYRVSDQGRVKSVDHWSIGRNDCLRRIKGRILKPGRHNTSGHLSVVLGAKNGSFRVHDLVALAFVGPKPFPTAEIRHLDGDASNNVWTNLEWTTRKRNSQDKKYHKMPSNYILKPETVAVIKHRLENPYKGIGVELARHFGVSESTISKIKMARVHTDVEAF